MKKVTAFLKLDDDTFIAADPAALRVALHRGYVKEVSNDRRQFIYELRLSGMVSTLDKAGLLRAQEMVRERLVQQNI